MDLSNTRRRRSINPRADDIDRLNAHLKTSRAGSRKKTKQRIARQERQQARKSIRVTDPDGA